MRFVYVPGDGIRQHLIIMLLGVCNIVDGLMLIVTLGFMKCGFSLRAAKYLARSRYHKENK